MVNYEFTPEQLAELYGSDINERMRIPTDWHNYVNLTIQQAIEHDRRHSSINGDLDWIEWSQDGFAKNPYGELSFMVEVKFHDGKIAKGNPRSFNWHYNAARANIVAHRPCIVSEKETIEHALKEALYLAVAVIAFIGRDEGTERLQATLDGLVTVALRTDPVIREAIGLLEKND